MTRPPLLTSSAALLACVMIPTGASASDDPPPGASPSAEAAAQGPMPSAASAARTCHPQVASAARVLSPTTLPLAPVSHIRSAPTATPVEVTVQLLPPSQPAPMVLSGPILRPLTWRDVLIGFVTPGVAFVIAWELAPRRPVVRAGRWAWRRITARTRWWFV